LFVVVIKSGTSLRYIHFLFSNIYSLWIQTGSRPRPGPCRVRLIWRVLGGCEWSGVSL